MPRHNFWKAAPYVKRFCKKHNLTYQNKPVFTAFADVPRFVLSDNDGIIFATGDFIINYSNRSLKVSGKLWNDAWREADLSRTKKD